MNGAFHAPPLTVPSVFADRQSRRESPKMASRPFQFLEKNAPKSERERPSTLRDWPPCPLIQRDGGWRSRPGVNPFISALTVARCLADFVLLEIGCGRRQPSFQYDKRRLWSAAVVSALGHFGVHPVK